MLTRDDLVNCAVHYFNNEDYYMCIMSARQAMFYNLPTSVRDQLNWLIGQAEARDTREGRRNVDSNGG